MFDVIDSTGGGVPTEDVIVGRKALLLLANNLLEADPHLSRQDALNEAFDHFCSRSGGTFLRGMDVFVDLDGEDMFAHAYGWRQF